MTIIEIPETEIFVDLDSYFSDRPRTQSTTYDALVQSIKETGQQTPIDVIKLEHPRGEKKYMLVEGLSRLIAIRDLRISTVKCIVLEGK